MLSFTTARNDVDRGLVLQQDTRSVRTESQRTKIGFERRRKLRLADDDVIVAAALKLGRL